MSFNFGERWKGALHGFGMKIAAARPEIMLIGGGLAVLFGTIEACKKTDEAKEIIEEHRETIKKIDEELKIQEEEGVEVLPATVKHIKIERGKRYVQAFLKTSFKLANTYKYAGLLWGGGMYSIVNAHTEVRKINKNLAADVFAGNQLINEYRKRVAQAVGKEAEERIFMGTQEEMIKIIEKDPKTGEECVVEKKADVFYAQPGSIFARNVTAETSDAFDVRTFADNYLQARVNEINKKLETGMFRAFNGIDIYRMLGFNENALTEKLDDDEIMEKLLRYGISGNARKVQDPEMRKLKVTRLRGYEKVWDIERNTYIFRPCLRLDFNFYPLEGRI